MKRLKAISQSLARSKAMKVIYIICCMIAGLSLLLDKHGEIISKIIGLGLIYYAISRSIRMFLKIPEVNPMEELNNLRRMDTESAIQAVMSKNTNMSLEEAKKLVEEIKG